MERLEQEITDLKLNHAWTKPVSTFINLMARLIDEHKSADTQNTCNDQWYITRFKNALNHDSEFRTHFMTNDLNETRIAQMAAALPGGGHVMPAETYVQFLSRVQAQAMTIDAANKKADTPRSGRQVSQAQGTAGRSSDNQSGGRGNTNEGRGGRGGRGRGNGQGRGGRGSRRPARHYDDYVSDEVYTNMSPEQRRQLWAGRNQNNNNNSNSNNAQTTSRNNGPPATVQVTTSASTPTTQNTTNNRGALLRNMLSTHNATTAGNDNATVATGLTTDTLTINGTTYRQVNVTYRVQQGQVSAPGALVDGGANGGLAGDDVRVLEESLGQVVDVSGITPHVLEGLPLVQTAGLVNTVSDGPIVVIMSQYAKRPTGQKTIHSKGQLEHFGCRVHDSSRAVGGLQCVVTPEGYVVPMSVRDGLHYMDTRPPTDAELQDLPHVFLTSDSPWDPKVLDVEFADTDPIPDDPEIQARRENRDARINDHGMINHPPHRDAELCFFDAAQDEGAFIEDIHNPLTLLERSVHGLLAFPQQLHRHFKDLDLLKPHFGWINTDRIQQTLEKTSQFYRAAANIPFRHHFKSRFPAANVRRLPEWYSTDTIFSDTPAADDGMEGHGGCKMAQLYGGISSGFLKLVPMKSEYELPRTLEEFIRDHGAFKGLKSDNAKSETSRSMHDILRMYCISDKQSEPHYEHQNPIERKIQDVKKMTSGIMDRVAVPAKYWLITMLFVVSLMNVIVNAHGAIPEEMVTGEVADVSGYLDFHFWEEVFAEDVPSGKERLGRWCGPCNKKGDTLTYWILMNDTGHLVARSNVRRAKDPLFPNRRSRPDPDYKPAMLSSVADYEAEPTALPRWSPDELLGMTFLRDTEDNQTVRAKVVKKILDRDAENHEKIKLLVRLGDGDLEEILGYSEICAILEDQHKAEESGEMPIFTYRKVLDHAGPIKPTDPNYKGSSWNVKLLWEDGSKTWEPLNIVGKDDPVTLAKYAKEHNLLDTPGWKFLARIGRRTKLLKRMIAASKRRQKQTAIRYKFGVRIPRNYQEAIDLDRENGNTLWQDAVQVERDAIQENDTYHSIGIGTPIPQGFTKIPVHFVFDCKQDGRRKGRMVAGGHVTPYPEDSVYSSVAAQRSLRIALLIGELNNLESMAGDIGYAYLQSYTKEKVAFIAGPDFGEYAGHTMIVDKAIYGLRSSGARYHERFAQTMFDLGFTPSYADPDVWMRDAGDNYEYVVVYVDDLVAVMKDPKSFFDVLQTSPHNYKLKGVGPLKYHLGADYYRDEDGTLCTGARTYAMRLLKNFEILYGELPRKEMSPLDKDDRPELDTSEFAGPDDIAKFQSIIGACQWMITLCRMDIAHAIMSLNRFRNAPRIGHIERVRRIIGYVRRFPHAAIRFRTGIPDHESVFGKEAKRYDWMLSVYGNVTEDIPENMPVPKGKPMRTTTFKDANLMHDLATGRSCTGIIHFLNQTPIDWFCKRQKQVETATYGSEFMAARQAIEQIIDLRYTLRMFGVPLDGPSWLFG
ncbi:MAG: reverse transcriptase domain-containing protein, partial [Rhodobacter sp.]|nr:reverse transcriptase domain-containing protein [Rhodobacter sp.]